MLKNVELLKAMRNAIANVGKVSVVTGLYPGFDENRLRPDKRMCLVANCYYLGVIADFDLAERIQFPEGFMSYFDCTQDEAEAVLFKNISIHAPVHETGKDYAAAIDELLSKHGHV